MIQSLSSAGIQRLAGYGDILKGVCPFHEGSAGKTFWVHVDSGAWGCWSTRCPKHSGGNLYKLFSALGYSSAEAARHVNTLKVSNNHNKFSGLNLNQLSANAVQKPSSLRDLDEGSYLRESHVIGWRVNWENIVNTSNISSTLDYVRSRFIPPETLNFLEVGFDRELQCLIFSLRDPSTGALRGIARRAPNPGAKYFFSASPFSTRHPNYKYRRVPKGEILWGYSAQKALIDSGATIVVVEGFFDVLRLSSYGICAVAKMGQRLTDSQAQILLDSGNRLVLWPDRDAAGIRGVSEDVTKLLAAPDLACVIPQSSDPGEAENPEAQVALKEAVPAFEFLAHVPNLLASV